MTTIFFIYHKSGLVSGLEGMWSKNHKSSLIALRQIILKMVYICGDFPLKFNSDFTSLMPSV